jgi:hypothetical protein
MIFTQLNISFLSIKEKRNSYVKKKHLKKKGDNNDIVVWNMISNFCYTLHKFAFQNIFVHDI